MTEVKGKIEKLNLNGSINKKNGEVVGAIILKLEGQPDVVKLTKGSPVGDFAGKLNLKIGDEVTLVKGGQYNSVIKILKPFAGGGAFKSGKSFGGSGGFVKKEYDPNGARNGMISGKAVELAIARKDLTKEGLEKAALDVLALANFVESQTKVDKKEVTETVDPFAATADTPTATDDFAAEDDVSF